ncbi:hypothetical protein BGZ49_007735 [Haplosporangium sp. Z 27]|nr:hypothetical protein BGZ49_007735 [Haplosporangium sp. Z 27]
MVLRLMLMRALGSTKSIAVPARRGMILKPCRNFSSSSHFKANETVRLTDEKSLMKHDKLKPTSNNKEWTPELDKQLSQLRAEHRTWEYISLALGRSMSVCSDRFYTTLDPELNNWTPSMFARLDQMVEEGMRWSDIAANLNQKSITCQHQWRTLGKGKYRVKGFSSTSQSLKWSQKEIDNFWTAWLQFDPTDWGAIAAFVGSKNEKECRATFKPLVMHALAEAPGWAKIETFTFVTETSRGARYRANIKFKESTPESTSEAGVSSDWTDAEHKALLEAVEKHGLFSDWGVIRKQVKPELTNDEVEAEYYQLNGVSDSIRRPVSYPTKATLNLKPHDGWSKEDYKQFNTILMKYSHLPIWKEEATKQGVEPKEDDHEWLFTRNTSKKSKLKENSPRSKKNTTFRWSEDRLRRLARLVAQQQQQERNTGQSINWSWIADHIAPGIDSGMCIAMWQNMPEVSKAQYESSKTWDDTDEALLEEGVKKYGKGWAMIQMNFLPYRSVDSIRRKFSNLQNKRNSIIAAEREMVLDQIFKNPDLDVDAVVMDKVKNDPVCQLAKRLEDHIEKFTEVNGKPR